MSLADLQAILDGPEWDTYPLEEQLDILSGAFQVEGEGVTDEEERQALYGDYTESRKVIAANKVRNRMGDDAPLKTTAYLELLKAEEELEEEPGEAISSEPRPFPEFKTDAAIRQLESMEVLSGKLMGAEDLRNEYTRKGAAMDVEPLLQTVLSPEFGKLRDQVRDENKDLQAFLDFTTSLESTEFQPWLEGPENPEGLVQVRKKPTPGSVYEVKFPNGQIEDMPFGKEQYDLVKAGTGERIVAGVSAGGLRTAERAGELAMSIFTIGKHGSFFGGTSPFNEAKEGFASALWDAEKTGETAFDPLDTPSPTADQMFAFVAQRVDKLTAKQRKDFEEHRGSYEVGDFRANVVNAPIRGVVAQTTEGLAGAVDLIRREGGGGEDTMAASFTEGGRQTGRAVRRFAPRKADAGALSQAIATITESGSGLVADLLIAKGVGKFVKTGTPRTGVASGAKLPDRFTSGGRLLRATKAVKSQIEKTAFTASATNKVVGSTYHEAFEAHRERGMGLNKAHELAALEAQTVGLFTALIERAGPAEFFLNPKQIKTIGDVVKTAFKGGMVEGPGEELPQAFVEVAMRDLMREDGSGSKEIKSLRRALGRGNMEAFKESEVIQGTIGGFGAGLGVGAGQAVAAKGAGAEGDPTIPESTADKTTPELEREANRLIVEEGFEDDTSEGAARRRALEAEETPEQTTPEVEEAGREATQETAEKVEEEPKPEEGLPEGDTDVSTISQSETVEEIVEAARELKLGLPAPASPRGRQELARIQAAEAARLQELGPVSAEPASPEPQPAPAAPVEEEPAPEAAPEPEPSETPTEPEPEPEPEPEAKEDPERKKFIEATDEHALSFDDAAGVKRRADKALKKGYITPDQHAEVLRLRKEAMAEARREAKAAGEEVEHDMSDAWAELTGSLDFNAEEDTKPETKPVEPAPEPEAAKTAEETKPKRALTNEDVNRATRIAKAVTKGSDPATQDGAIDAVIDQLVKDPDTDDALLTTVAKKAASKRGVRKAEREAKEEGRVGTIDTGLAEAQAGTDRMQPDEAAAVNDVVRQIDASVAELSTVEREALHGAARGETNAEIAERLGTTPNTVANAKSRGRKKLRKKLGDDVNVSPHENTAPKQPKKPKTDQELVDEAIPILSERTTVPEEDIRKRMRPTGKKLNKAQRTAKAIAEFFGRRVVYVTGLKINGMNLRSMPGTIFISDKVSRSEMLVVAHELLHSLAATDPDAYARLKAAVAVDLKAFVEKFPSRKNLREDVTHEEFLADFLADRMTDPDFWEGLAKKDRPLFAKLVKLLKGIMKSVQKGRFGTEAFVADLAKADAALREALVTMAMQGDIAPGSDTDIRTEQRVTPEEQSSLDDFIQSSENLIPQEFATKILRLWQDSGGTLEDFGMQHWAEDSMVVGGTNRMIGNYDYDADSWTFTLDEGLTNARMIEGFNALPDSRKTVANPIEDIRFEPGPVQTAGTPNIFETREPAAYQAAKETVAKVFNWETVPPDKTGRAKAARFLARLTNPKFIKKLQDAAVAAGVSEQDAFIVAGMARGAVVAYAAKLHENYPRAARNLIHKLYKANRDLGFMFPEGVTVTASMIGKALRSLRSYDGGSIVGMFSALAEGRNDFIRKKHGKDGDEVVANSEAVSNADVEGRNAEDLADDIATELDKDLKERVTKAEKAARAAWKRVAQLIAKVHKPSKQEEVRPEKKEDADTDDIFQQFQNLANDPEADLDAIAESFEKLFPRLKNDLQSAERNAVRRAKTKTREATEKKETGTGTTKTSNQVDIRAKRRIGLVNRAPNENTAEQAQLKKDFDALMVSGKGRAEFVNDYVALGGTAEVGSELYDANRKIIERQKARRAETEARQEEAALERARQNSEARREAAHAKAQAFVDSVGEETEPRRPTSENDTPRKAVSRYMNPNNAVDQEAFEQQLREFENQDGSPTFTEDQVQQISTRANVARQAAIRVRSLEAQERAEDATEKRRQRQLGKASKLFVSPAKRGSLDTRSVRDIILEDYINNPERRIMSREERIAFAEDILREKTDIPEEEIHGVALMIEEQLANRLTEEKFKAAKPLLKALGGKNLTRGQIEKAVRLEVLDPAQDFVTSVAALSGWEGLTEQESNRLAELQREIDQVGPQSRAGMARVMEQARIIESAPGIPPGIKETVNAYIRGSIYSSIGSQLVGITVGIWSSHTSLLQEFAATVARHKGNIGATLAELHELHKGWARNISRGIREFGRVMRTGSTFVEQVQGGQEGRGKLEGRIFVDPLTRTYDEANKKLRKAIENYRANPVAGTAKILWQAFRKWVIASGRFTFRMLSAVDAGFTKSNAGVLSNILAHRRARDMGITKNELNHIYEEAQRQAEAHRSYLVNEVGLTNPNEIAIEVADAIEGGIHQALSERGVEGLETLLDEAASDFQDKIGTGETSQRALIGKATQTVTSLIHNFPFPLAGLIPAVRTVGNVIDGLMWTAPGIGIYRAIRHSNKFGGTTSSRNSYFPNIKADWQFRRRQATAILTNGLTLGIMALLKANEDEPDDEKWFWWTGTWPHLNDAEKDRWRRNNWTENTLIVGGLRFRLDRGFAQTLFVPVSMSAMLYEATDGVDGKEFVKNMVGLGELLIPGFSQGRDRFQATETVYGFENFAENQASMMVPFSALMKTGRRLAPKVDEQNTTAHFFQHNPFYSVTSSDGVSQFHNVLGEPLAQDADPWGWLKKIGSPIYFNMSIPDRDPTKEMISGDFFDHSYAGGEVTLKEFKARLEKADHEFSPALYQAWKEHRIENFITSYVGKRDLILKSDNYSSKVGAIWTKAGKKADRQLGIK